MTIENKIISLRKEIEERILPLLSDKVVIVDAPYYDNIGDILIWQGLVDFLTSNGKIILNTTSGSTFPYPVIAEDVTIILMGGGNFGDLWRWFQDTRLNVISHYPNNRIVLLPQSVWYNDINLIEKDAQILSEHKNLFLCARDQWSFSFMKKNFPKNNILLVPDMAFYINDSSLAKYRNKTKNKRLFLRRMDKEITDSTPLIISKQYEIHDWPTIEKKPRRFYYFDKAYGLAYRLNRFPFFKSIMLKSTDKLAQYYIKDSLFNIGCKFLSSYSTVTTTRLHALILAFLLHIPVSYMDNSTRKLSSLVKTWLDDVDIVKPYEL